jgi:hypothetical protein
MPSGYAAWHIDQEKKRPGIVKNTSISISFRQAEKRKLRVFFNLISIAVHSNWHCY